MEIIHEKNKPKHMAFVYMFTFGPSLADSSLPISQIRKLKVTLHSTNYKNILFQDPKVEIDGEHFDCEKGKGDEVDETIQPFCATLWPETVFNSRRKSKISSKFDKLESVVT